MKVYRGVEAQLQHFMESDCLHVPATLLLGKESPVPIDQKAVWPQVSVSVVEKKKSLFQLGFETWFPSHPAHIVGIILIAVPELVLGRTHGAFFAAAYLV